MKLPLITTVTVNVAFDDIQKVIDEIKELQTYRMSETDDMILVDRAKVADILSRHLRVNSSQKKKETL